VDLLFDLPHFPHEQGEFFQKGSACRKSGKKGEIFAGSGVVLSGN
jgi:hypothetical protein